MAWRSILGVMAALAALATQGHAQDATPASMRRLAACWSRWAAHTPPRHRPGPCDRHGWDCIDPPDVDPADAVLARCVAREHGPAPVFDAPLGGGPVATAAGARGVAPCLRGRAARAEPRPIDVEACTALSTLTVSAPDASARLPHGAEVWLPAADPSPATGASALAVLRSEAMDLALAACSPASGTWQGWFYARCAAGACEAALVSSLDATASTTPGGEPLEVCIDRALASGLAGYRGTPIVAAVRVSAPPE